MTTVRILSYNILMGGRRGAALDEVVRGVAPDILVVAEAPKLPVLGDRRSRRLCERWNMSRVIGGRAAGSNLILTSSRVAPVVSSSVVLPTPRFAPRRGVVAARFRVDGVELSVVGCHLSLGQAERLHEAAEVIRLADGLGEPCVIAGDLNDVPESATWELFQECGFEDHGTSAWPTFPSDAPTKRIDAILTKGLRVLSHGDPGVDPELLAAASDHRPVLAVSDV